MKCFPFSSFNFLWANTLQAEGEAFAEEEESDKEAEEEQRPSGIQTLAAAPAPVPSSSSSAEDGAVNTTTTAASGSDDAEFVGVATPASVLAAKYAVAEASGKVVSLDGSTGMQVEGTETKEAVADAGSKRKHMDGDDDDDDEVGGHENSGGGVVAVKREEMEEEEECGDAGASAEAGAEAGAAQGNENVNDDQDDDRDEDDDDEEEDLEAPPLMPFVSAFAGCGPSSPALPRLSRASSNKLGALLASGQGRTASR